MLTLFKGNKYIFCSLALWSLFFYGGCSTVLSSQKRDIVKVTKNPEIAKRSSLTQSERSHICEIAQKAIGKSSLKVGNRSFRNDCSGTVRAIFRSAGINLGGIIKNKSENDVKAIYRYVQRYGKIVKTKPAPGDLVFFHNTYDRSRNGRMNDALTHIGIVEKIENNTVHFIHHLGQSIIRSRMNLSYPQETFHPANKDRINHVLRKAQGKHRAYTAAELFAGFGRL